MACQNYKVIQLTNANIGAVAANAYMPLGTITRRISQSAGSAVPFVVTTSGADTVELTSKGYYKVQYSLTALAAAAGVVTVALIVNGTSVYSVSQTAAVIGQSVNLNLDYVTRVFANCASCATNCPQDIQLQLTGVAITGGTSNLIVDSCANG